VASPADLAPNVAAIIGGAAEQRKKDQKERAASHEIQLTPASYFAFGPPPLPRRWPSTSFGGLPEAVPKSAIQKMASVKLDLRSVYLPQSLKFSKTATVSGHFCCL